MTQGIYEQIGTFAPIETERHLVQVGREMLGADFVPASHDAALEQRECRFDRVCGDHEAILVSDVLLCPMIDALPLFLMASEIVVVQDGFVGNDHIYIFADVLLQRLANCFFRSVFAVDEFQITLALDDADDHCLIVFVSAPDSLSASANVGFVNFNRAVHHRADFAHSSADSVAEIPCRLVRASVLAPKCPLELHCAHALLGLAKQEDGDKPDRQGQMRVMEDRSACGCELVLAANALVTCVISQSRNTGVFASRTHDTFGPAETFKQFAAAVVSRIERVNFRECHDRAS